MAPVPDDRKTTGRHQPQHSLPNRSDVVSRDCPYPAARQAQLLVVELQVGRSTGLPLDHPFPPITGYLPACSRAMNLLDHSGKNNYLQARGTFPNPPTLSPPLLRFSQTGELISPRPDLPRSLHDRYLDSGSTHHTLV